MNDSDEQLQYLNLLYDHLYIKYSQTIKDFDINLTNLLNQIILTGRNIFMLLFTNQVYIDVKDFSSRIENFNFKQFQEIISYLVPEKTTFKMLKEKNHFEEIIKSQSLLRTAFSQLKIFGLGIHHYFLPKRQSAYKSEYFGTIIYPSIFSYFTFQEMIENSYRLLMITMIQATYEFQNKINDTHFFNGALNSVEGIMFSSFFNGFPHFISGFCHFFVNLVNKNANSFHLGSLLDFICKSLEFSSQYLTPYHIKILKYVKKYRKIEFFKNFFMIRVLQNNLNLYLDADIEIKCKCNLSKKIIIEQFECFTTKLDPSYQEKIYETYIQKIIGCKTFSFAIQSLEKKFNKTVFFIYLSEFDTEIINSILQDSIDSNKKSKNSMKTEKRSFRPRFLDFMIQCLNTSTNLFLDNEIERNINKPIEGIDSKYDMDEITNQTKSIKKNENDDSKSGFILNEIKSLLNTKVYDKNDFFRMFENDDCGKLMKSLCQSKYEDLSERYTSIFLQKFINEYETEVQKIEKYIDSKINLSYLDSIYLSFKQRQEIFLSFISSVITNSITFSDGQLIEFTYPEHYIFNFKYIINNSKSVLMNPYFELISYKEVHLSSEFDVLMHQNQLLQKFKEFFDSEIKNADSYIKELSFEGRRKVVVDELIATLSNIFKVPISDRLLVISNVIYCIFQIVESLKIDSENLSENIFLNVYLKSNSVVVLPTFLIYSYLFNHNNLFQDVMNDFNPKIKKAIDLLENAIVNIFLDKKPDLQVLIRNFTSSLIVHKNKY